MSIPALRFTGPLRNLSAADRAALLDRSTARNPEVRSTTASILAAVRQGGDEALRELARRFDDVDLETLEVPQTRWQSALDALDPSLRRAMERAITNLHAVHAAFRPWAMDLEPEPGVRIGRRPDPLGCVGIYAPGGRAAYPSSVLMGAVPARVAGVREVVLCSPPERSGFPAPVVLAAAALTGVDRVFSLGGAGAIGAMAFGTESVPRVDRIVGPGNAWVAEAKLQVSGQVAIDSPAGPSELLVLADGDADLDGQVREMLAQAEHDPAAAVVAVVTDGIGPALAARLVGAIAREPRAAVIAEALATRGGVLDAVDVDEAVAFANLWAAEHLLVVTRNPMALLPRLRNAGTILIGASSSVAFGDYLTGANHVLPTGGLARCYSGLSTLDFIRWTTWQEVSPAAASGMASDVDRFALAEGLPGHAAAARQWSTP